MERILKNFKTKVEKLPCKEQEKKLAHLQREKNKRDFPDRAGEADLSRLKGKIHILKDLLNQNNG